MTIDVPAELARHHGGDNLLAGGLKFAETFRLWGGLAATDAVLDIGCGPGRMALGIGETFGWTNDYIGFDIKKSDIEFCQNNITVSHPSFRFIHIDIMNDHYNPSGAKSASSVRFPAGDSWADFIFATSIFTHFYRKDIENYLKECARVGRKTVLTTWFIIDELYDRGREARTCRFAFPHRAADGTYFEHTKSPLDAVGHTMSSIEEMHAAAGLQITAVHHGAWTRQNPAPARHSQDVIVARVA